jgi:hypothetical protein
MTIEQITAVCIGMTLNAATFVLGVLVGCSLLKRKEPENGDCDKEAKNHGHHTFEGGSSACSGDSWRRGSEKDSEADSAQRALARRHADRD